MDPYTQSTMDWLNRRYRKTAPDGVYLAHQPIYGILDPHSEPNVLERYLRTFHILRTLSQLQGHSLLDVGASEGFQASLARDLLGLDTTGCDLSEEACRRAAEIFGLVCHQADARALPFEDEQFDLIVCSETLEHIKEYEPAVNELLRVAGNAVVITVPHESHEQTAQNQAIGDLHAHINAFDVNTRDFLNNRGMTVLATRLRNRHWFHPNRWIERLRLSNSEGRRLAEPLSHLFIHTDTLLVEAQNVYHGIIFVILKDGSVLASPKKRTIQLSDIFNHRVPHHYVGASAQSGIKSFAPLPESAHRSGEHHA